MSVQEEIIAAMETMVANYLDKHHKTSQTRVIPSVVTDMKNKEYNVNIDGNHYWIKNGTGIALHIGMPVWVMVPNGIIGDMFIIGKK